MFSVEYDEATGIICCTPSGFLSPTQVQQYVNEVDKLVQQSLREYGNVTILVSASEAKVASPETMKAAHFERKRFGPDYRMAIVAASALTKLQAGRLFPTEQVRVFTAEADALAWLIASRQAAPTRTATIA